MRPWPEVPEEDRWVIALMEELLEETGESPAQLRNRASELRDEAGCTDIHGYREAALALADRYEHAAAARLGSH
jgi:hypothetical protein